MLVASTPETTNPVATQCEIEGVPCISTVAPWQPYFIGRQSNPGDPGSWQPFDYTYHFFWGLEDVIAVFTNMWGQLETNKSVGGLFPNDGDGNAWGDPVVGFPPVLAEARLHAHRSRPLPEPHRRFFRPDRRLQERQCEILTGVVLPPDFTTFWNQALQQGFRPKIASIGKAILFPVAVEALGENGHNLSSEVWWSPSHPFSSSLTGQSAKDFAAAYEAGDQPPMDAADRLRARAVRGGARRAEAGRGSGRARRDRGGDRRDRPRHDRRPDPVGLRQAAAVRAEEHRQDAAGRRPVAARRTAAATRSSSPTTRRRRKSPPPTRCSRSGSGLRGHQNCHARASEARPEHPIRVPVGLRAMALGPRVALRLPEDDER